MTLIDWLGTTDGAELVRAVTLLAVAVAGYINWRTHQKVGDVEKKVDSTSEALNGHLIQHIEADPPPDHNMQ